MEDQYEFKLLDKYLEETEEGDPLRKEIQDLVDYFTKQKQQAKETN